MMTFEVEFEFWERKEVTQTQIRQVWGPWNHWNTLFGQKSVHGDDSVAERCCDAASKCPQSLAGHSEPFFWAVQACHNSTVDYLFVLEAWLPNEQHLDCWKNKLAWIWIFDLLILDFFGQGELLVCHPELCRLVSRSHSKIHNSSPVMTCLKKFS